MHKFTNTFNKLDILGNNSFHRISPTPTTRYGDNFNFLNKISLMDNLDISVLNKKIKMKNSNVKKTISKTIPSYNSAKVNKTAKSLGFKDNTDLNNFIKKINPNKLSISETKKVSKLYYHLSKIAKSKPKSIAKLAIAGGTITTMILFLQKYQNIHCGCFRYEKNKNENDQDIKYKFMGTWCNNNNNNDNEKVKLLPENEHPLYNKKKWDCNYNKFPKGNNQIDKILNLGCNGLCNLENFNILAKTTNGEYEPITYKQFDKYIYKCETMTILQALSISTGDVLNETFSGFFDSDLGKHLIKNILRILFIIMLIYILIKFCLHVKK